MMDEAGSGKPRQRSAKAGAPSDSQPAKAGTTKRRAAAPKRAPKKPQTLAQDAAPKEAPPKAPSPEPAAPKTGASGTGGYSIGDPAQFTSNMIRVGQQSQKLLSDYMTRQSKAIGQQPLDPLNIMGAFSDLLAGMAANPAPFFQATYTLWNDYLNLWERSARRMMGETVEPVVSPARGDKRFRDKDWQESQVFDFIKQSYLLTANWLQSTVGNIDGVDPAQQKRIRFYTKQFADAMAPTNFVLTNPEVLRTTLQSNGENLVKGLTFLLEDLERGQGQLSIRQTADAFKVGENIALSPGKVIFRNELVELLQYDPSTEQVYERPLLIFPPWINKFYILDLRTENSFIKWLTEQGYTVFVASWVNPDRRLAQKTFEDYMRGGIFACLDAVEQATGVRAPNVVGYCIGGTLLSTTLAYMATTGDDRIHSATFWAAQADFTEAGDLSVFVDDAQLESMQQQMEAAGGVLEGARMATTFNMLRANDLIWSFVVNNYLLGKEPMPFDLLYWNSDVTRMPEKTHLFYLREFYKNNALARGKLSIGGKKLDLKKVKVPVYLQSAREDHIAPFRSVFRATRLYGGSVRFILAGSGHIAGVINAPAAKKYQYWTNDTLPETVEEWQQNAQEHPGSWWPDWDRWLSKLSGKKVPARKPGDGKLRPLGDAPGSYVKIKAQ
ncbi:MAG TPA: class I poly(R)-hydroxyalkanoic acid synthase [Rhizomicrobium sp.]|nr:class I poly(R)-hydroxyalkanoic acid synthase [Rhizomicrobium sp.]